METLDTVKTLWCKYVVYALIQHRGISLNYVLMRAVETNKTDCKLFFPVFIFEYKYNNGVYK